MKKRKQKTPNSLVSVVMPVYNAGPFLVEAIESILGQTYRKFEFIIVDDGSTDNSFNILQEYAQKDKRIKVIKNSRNLGAAQAATIGIKKAKGDFIARMDADDVAFPNRLEKQIKFLKENKDILAVGGQCVLIDRGGKVIGQKTFPTSPKEIYEKAFIFCPVQQPTLMVNKKLLPKNFVWYKSNFPTGEELSLIFNLLSVGKVANLPDFLLCYREHPNSLSHSCDQKEIFFKLFKYRWQAIKKYGYRPTLKGIILSLIQLGVVSVLPRRLIYPLFTLWRGMKKIEIQPLNCQKVHIRPFSHQKPQFCVRKWVDGSSRLINN